MSTLWTLLIMAAVVATPPLPTPVHYTNKVTMLPIVRRMADRAMIQPKPAVTNVVLRWTSPPMPVTLVNLSLTTNLAAIKTWVVASTNYGKTWYRVSTNMDYWGNHTFTRTMLPGSEWLAPTYGWIRIP